MTYDYKCDNCGNFTIEQSIKDNAITKCPKCGSNVQRIFKPVGVLVRCSGFCGKIGS